ncbi:glycosyltransferase [Methanofollis ethanolicus]|uniref:glycosyltransferase n=1 Tax=Methanofollis ethanolicus TaxID=488124 RepID=UPI000835F87E|nr:glycosyltransferase [Methanofollis ethanolicus]
MKICILADARTTHIKRWVEYFSEKHEVDLITLSYTVPERTTIGEEVYEKMPNVRLHKVSKKIPDILLAPFRIRKLISEIKPDIVHAHYVTHYGFCGAFSGFHPLVVSAWGSDVLIDPFDSILYKQMVCFALKHADMITSDGYNSKSAMVKLGIKEDKIKIIYHGVDVSIFCPEKRDRSIIWDLFSGDYPTVISDRGLEPIYDVESLIRAIPIIKTEIPDVRFIIAREDYQKAYLMNLAKSLNVFDSIKFVGLIKHEDLPLYLSSSDIYVSTSLSDGGTAVSNIEGMACGLPPVVTNVGDNHRWVEDGVNGFLVPPKNPYYLAEKIIYLLKNISVRKKFGDLSRKIVEANANYYSEMEKMNTIYHALSKRYKI